MKQLLKTKDIKEILSNPESYSYDFIKYISLYKDKTETYNQQAFKRECNLITLQYKDKLNIMFKQNDNGGYQKGSTRIRKFCEGTISGASDCEVWISLKAKPYIKHILFFEIKRLGTFTINDNQVNFINKMKQEFDCDSYITNNLFFFKEKIIEKISLLIK